MNKQYVLITGFTGFVGSHLAEYLLSLGDHKIIGTYRSRSRFDNVKHLLDKVELIECDLTEPLAVDNLITKSYPNKIFHLAAQSFVPTSWTHPTETFRTNVNSTINILESVKSYKPDAKVLIPGSSEEYGFVKRSEIPIVETNPLRPLSPYAVSKVTQDLLGYQYYRSYGLNIVRTRAFNHEAYRRTETFVTANFAKQIVQIERGLTKPVIYVGNLSAIRDFSDARDVVKAYDFLCSNGKPGEVYNICSGKGLRISEMLYMLLNLSTTKNIEIKVDQDRMRPSDVPILIGNCDKMKKIYKYEPNFKFEQTLEDMLNYYRGMM